MVLCGLEPNSIDNFDQLSNAFMKQYSTHILKQASEADLWKIRQGVGDSPRAYIKKFRAVGTKLSNPNDQVAIEALRRGLWYKSELWSELTLNPPPTIDDGLHKASRYVTLEEETAALDKLHKKPQNHPKGEASEAKGPHKRGTLETIRPRENIPTQSRKIRKKNLSPQQTKPPGQKDMMITNTALITIGKGTQLRNVGTSNDNWQLNSQPEK